MGQLANRSGFQPLAYSQTAFQDPLSSPPASGDGRVVVNRRVCVGRGTGASERPVLDLLLQAFFVPASFQFPARFHLPLDPRPFLVLCREGQPALIEIHIVSHFHVPAVVIRIRHRGSVRRFVAGGFARRCYLCFARHTLVPIMPEQAGLFG